MGCGQYGLQIPAARDSSRQSPASPASAFAVCEVGLSQDPVHCLASVEGVDPLGLRGQEGTGIYSSCCW